MAIILCVLSAACFVGATISLLRYDSKHFDLLVLCAVILLGTAAPSFEVDASLEELRSINHRLLDVRTAIEGLQRPAQRQRGMLASHQRQFVKSSMRSALQGHNVSEQPQFGGGIGDHVVTFVGKTYHQGRLAVVV